MSHGTHFMILLVSRACCVPKENTNVDHFDTQIFSWLPFACRMKYKLPRKASVTLLGFLCLRHIQP